MQKQKRVFSQNASDWLANYVKPLGGETVKAVKKRVHSRAFDYETRRCKDAGRSEDDCKKLRSEVASREVERWVRLMKGKGYM